MGGVARDRGDPIKALCFCVLNMSELTLAEKKRILETEEKKIRSHNFRVLEWLGLIPIDGGAFGSVGRTRDGSHIVKYGEILHREYDILTNIQSLAAEYLPVPAALRYVERLEHPYLLEMMNPGPTLEYLNRHHPLSHNERILCQLQWIHFLMLCSGSVLLNDQTPQNICIGGRGPEIQLRFIEFGSWKILDWNKADKKKLIHHFHASMRLFGKCVFQMRGYTTFIDNPVKMVRAFWYNGDHVTGMLNLADYLGKMMLIRSYSFLSRKIHLLNAIHKSAVSCRRQLQIDKALCETLMP